MTSLPARPRALALSALISVALAACGTVQRQVDDGGAGGVGTTSTSAGGTGTASTSETGSTTTTTTSSSTTTTTGAGGAPPVTIDVACGDFAVSMCKRLQDCGPVMVDLSFGDYGTCVARYALFCQAFAGAVDATWTGAGVQGCAADLQNAPCGDVLLTSLTGGPAACQPPPGLRADGASCGNSSQCQSGYCNHAGVSLCGTCGPRGAKGDPCDSVLDCQPGMGCVAGSPSYCYPSSPEGGSCAPGQQPCDVGLLCLGGVCRRPLGQGETCTVGAGECDAYAGLYCNGPTASCQPPLLANPGDKCGMLSQNEATLCRGGSLCYNPPTIGYGVCQPVAADGEACNNKNGPTCMLPALCVSGICTLPASCN